MTLDGVVLIVWARYRLMCDDASHNADRCVMHVQPGVSGVGV